MRYFWWIKCYGISCILEFVFELKFLTISKRSQFEAKRAEAIQQLQEYVASDDNLKHKSNLRAYAVIFVGQGGTVIDVKDESVIYQSWLNQNSISILTK